MINALILCLFGIVGALVGVVLIDSFLGAWRRYKAIKKGLAEIRGRGDS